MAWRQLFLESPAVLRLKKSLLEVQTGWEPVTVPLEDLDVLLIESRRTELTAAVLAALAQHGCAVLLCDEKHLPCAALLPYAQHSRQPEVLQRQLALREPQKKRLWQQVVRAKVANQAACLRLCGRAAEAEALDAMCGRVLSGDTGNVEATAAARYFPALFGAGFVRTDEADLRNAALHYGYAVLRGAVARSVAAAGLLPAAGLHHRNLLNAFNLADDLIEPFRPVVDLYVAQRLWADDPLTGQVKQALFSLLNVDMEAGGQRHTVSRAAEQLVQSFVRCCAGEADALLLPALLPLKQHQYA